MTIEEIVDNSDIAGGIIVAGGMLIGGLLIITVAALMMAFPFIPVGIIGVLSLIYLNRATPTA